MPPTAPSVTSPFTSMRSLKAAVVRGTVIECLAHTALPVHTRTVTRVTTQGFYFQPSYAPPAHRAFFPWPLRHNVTFHEDGSWTVQFASGTSTGAGRYRIAPPAPEPKQ